MPFIQVTILIFVGMTGTAVALTRNPVHQVIGLSFYGIILGLFFFILQAPDVALSQITIGAVVLPLMFMLALGKIRRQAQRKSSTDHPGNARGVQ